MRFHTILASLVLSVTAAAVPIGCGGSGGDTASSSQGAGGNAASSTQGAGGDAASSSQGAGGQAGTGGAGGQSADCSAPPIDYYMCGGDSFFPDGSCAGGSCAVNDPEAKVYAAWRARVKELSGLTDQELDARVTIRTIENNGSFVRIEYLVVYDWVRSRQVDSADLGDASSPPTDAQIKKAVDLAIEDAEWTSIGAIDSVAPEADVRATFAGCECGIDPDWCHIDFMNVTGRFTARGIKVINAAENQCRQARVDVVTAELVSCDVVPCAIN